MKRKVTFVEVTTKTVEIDGEFMTDIMDTAHSYLEEPEKIDFDKNPDSYEVYIKKMKEVVA